MECGGIDIEGNNGRYVAKGESRVE